jgi:hypothetical protein
LVAIDGGLVLEKSLDRKPRDCEQCGFNRWVKKDKMFIIQRNNLMGNETPTAMMYQQHQQQAAASGGGGRGGGGTHRTSQQPPLFGGSASSMEWICPDCALQRGLPPEHYHKNFYATMNPQCLKLLEEKQKQQQEKEKETRGCTAGEGWNIFDISTYMCS